MNDIRVKSLRVVVLSVGLTMTVPGIFAQAGSQANSMTDEQRLDQQVDLMRKDIRSQKKQIVAANLKLTDQEAEKFWPIYDRYTADLVKVNDTKYALIKQYVQNFDSLSDNQLDNSGKQWLDMDQSVAQLRLKYFPTFRKVLSARNTVLFYQLDRRLVNMIDLKIASGIPLVQP